MPKKTAASSAVPSKPARKKDPKAQQKPVEDFSAPVRRLKPPKRLWHNPRTWRKSHEPTPAHRPLPAAYRILATAFRQLWGAKKMVGGTVLVYGILNVILVKGLSASGDVQSIKTALDGGANGGAGAHLSSAFVSFAYLLATSGSDSTQAASVYQYLLLLVCSLAFIWLLRQLTAQHTVRIRDGFYSGMYPLVPFILVLFIVCLQLLPLLISTTLLSFIFSNGIASTIWEQILFIVPTILLSYWTLRMVTASVFAVYIVTLPDMTPLRALRSAKQLVRGRRLNLFAKLLFLPFALLLLACLVELPLILFATPVAPWMFLVLSIVAFAVVHAYLYTLYREML
ncbi:MAG TPA: hypothetical protein VLF59_04595 [Candidatus Saccharimonadales bacterium]|nr:hypothetical protein [Candidatus Saccharimonadales bacterium]